MLVSVRLSISSGMWYGFVSSPSSSSKNLRLWVDDVSVVALIYAPINGCSHCERIVHLGLSDRVFVGVSFAVLTFGYLFAILKVFITVAQIPGGMKFVCFFSFSSSFLNR